MRLIRTLLLVLLVFCVVFFGALVRSRMRGKRFTSIHPGEPIAAVQDRVGPPTQTMQCDALPEPPALCARVLVYAGPLRAVMPEYWLLAVDASGKVLRVFHTTHAG